MGFSAQVRRWYHVKIRLLCFLNAAIVVVLCLAFPSWRTLSLLHAHRPSIEPPVEFAIPGTTRLHMPKPSITILLSNVTYASSSKEDAFEEEAGVDHELESDGDRNSRKGFNFEKGEMLNKKFKAENLENAVDNFTQKRPKYGHGLIEQTREIDNIDQMPLAPEAPNTLVSGKLQDQENNMQFVSHGIPLKGFKIMSADLRASDQLITGNISSNGTGMQSMEMHPKNEETELLKTTLPILKNKSKIGALSTRNKLVQPTSITHINSLLLQSYNSSSMRPRWFSQRDRELLSAKLEIENAPIISNASELYAPVFRDVSKFIRSYELMERKLKVYVYKEGEKPIFHQPKMRGLYASEGWFMKLMEANKRFVVRDPRKAHLFYLPLSIQMLRVTLSGQNLQRRQMEQYLEKYVHLIAGKYRFWNRTAGADHFLVACHDWASHITRHLMRNCIRSLCNANVAQGFKIGKDASLPVTYIHSMMDPVRGIGENPPSEKPILAFFAGSLHGYLREILLKYWENKEPDMKIFGPMPRDVEGKRTYREYMKNSKYCLCARGYEVHTPRIVEAILFECVPVIISDNYVPPFFEVLNWEEFSLFVQERDIPHLRNILLSVPEEKYLALQLGVKKVQKHFLWHRSPVKYDLFHMILHSVWYNRVFQVVQCCYKLGELET